MYYSESANEINLSEVKSLVEPPTSQRIVQLVKQGILKDRYMKYDPKSEHSLPLIFVNKHEKFIK